MPVTHLKNIYAEGELLKEANLSGFPTGLPGDQADSAISMPLLPYQSLRVQRRARTFRQVL